MKESRNGRTKERTNERMKEKKDGKKERKKERKEERELLGHRPYIVLLRLFSSSRRNKSVISPKVLQPLSTHVLPIYTYYLQV
jgi:hypothetical protein